MAALGFRPEVIGTLRGLVVEGVSEENEVAAALCFLASCPAGQGLLPDARRLIRFVELAWSPWGTPLGDLSPYLGGAERKGRWARWFGA